MLKIKTIPVTPFAQNARILWREGNSEALMIDPGGEADRLLKELDDRKLHCTQIWLTHSHVDHCGAVKAIREKHKSILYGHETEKVLRSAVTTICAMYGFPDADVDNCPEPDTYLRGGETLDFLGEKFQVLFTPGHSPGHVAFYNAQQGFVLSGDVLFAGSIGRTDLPGGNHSQLMQSIAGLLKQLPTETRVLSGHGPDTTLATEQETNPFLE